MGDKCFTVILGNRKMTGTEFIVRRTTPAERRGEGINEKMRIPKHDSQHGRPFLETILSLYQKRTVT